jgi:hypothetical protein
MANPKTPWALMTIESHGQRPTLADAARFLRVPVEAVSESFGVVLIDPDRGLYAVSVDAEALATAGPAGRAGHGPFANPPIEPLEG